MDRDKLAASRFNCTVRDGCIFETGIKLATVYHQYVGTPFDSSSIGSLETAIAESIMAQPYVTDVSISIDRSVLPDPRDNYSYVSLRGEMIDAKVTVSIENVSVTSEMRYDVELGYPLMYVSDISES